MRVDGVERSGELRVALVFAVGGRLELRFLRGESCRELLRIVARGEPSVGEEGGGRDSGENTGAEKDDVECGFHLEIRDLKFKI